MLDLFRFILGACIFSFIGYLVQRGKCPGCEMRIAGQYIWIGGLGGAAFVASSVCFGCGSIGILSLKGWIVFLYMGILTAVAFIDWNTKVIYDCFHIFIVLLGIAALWLFPEHSLADRLAGIVITAFPMLVLALTAAGAFGGGDIKLMAASGWLLGWRAMIPSIVIGILSGGIYCIWMLARGKMTRKDRFSFGPFLAIGLALACFYGEQMLEW